MTASDKLVIWLFQSHPDRLLQRLPDLAEDAGADRFVAPVVTALEHRPADPKVLLRLDAKSGRVWPAPP